MSSGIMETEIQSRMDEPQFEETIPNNFRKELIALINKHSIENIGDVPDFILADMICDFIETQGNHIKKLLDWHNDY